MRKLLIFFLSAFFLPQSPYAEPYQSSRTASFQNIEQIINVMTDLAFLNDFGNYEKIINKTVRSPQINIISGSNSIHERAVDAILQLRMLTGVPFYVCLSEICRKSANIHLVFTNGVKTQSYASINKYVNIAEYDELMNKLFRNFKYF